MRFDRLNYHHLLYFYVAAREGSVVRAAAELHLAQPTISAQIRKLEQTLGGKLFERAGRGLQLTELGRTVYRYADEIFQLGRELGEAVAGRVPGRTLPFVVGVTEVMPKLIVRQLLEPALALAEPMRLTCVEGEFDELLTQLATFQLDLVLSDTPVGPQIRVRAYNHSLGQAATQFFAAPALARRCRGFPECLAKVPVLLPLPGTALRRGLDQKFDLLGIRPNLVGEFSDSALMKALGQHGLGVFPGPQAIQAEIERQYGVRAVGGFSDVTERFYAITVERRLKHPAAVAVSQGARQFLAR